MSLRVLFIIFLNCFFSCTAQKEGDTVKKKFDFKDLLVSIREETISESDARKVFGQIHKEYKAKYASPNLDSANYQMVFPLKSKNYRSVGGRGRGFHPRLFNLFDHSVSASHPAHDIFIYDLNRDCKDDNDGEFIDIVSVNDGVVVATETNWKEGDGFKGGNYVWVYDFASGGLWYYAHMRKTYVVKNQIVQAGDKLGEVGRSGFNADNRRSDTHLHLMFLDVNEFGNPRPVNHYPWLKKAKTVYETQLPSHFPRKEFDIQSYLGEKKRASLLMIPTKTFELKKPLFLVQKIRCI